MSMGWLPPAHWCPTLVSHGPCPSIRQEDQPVHGTSLQVSGVVSIPLALELSQATTVPSSQFTHPKAIGIAWLKPLNQGFLGQQGHQQGSCPKPFLVPSKHQLPQDPSCHCRNLVTAGRQCRRSGLGVDLRRSSASLREMFLSPKQSHFDACI